MGIGTTTSTIVPTTVKGLTKVTAIVTARNTTCAISGAGKLSCWGYNDSGQVGDGTRTNQSLPRPVVGFSSGTRTVAPSASFTCGVTGGGAAMCWGSSYYGELGDGNSGSSSLTPKPVSGLGSGVTAISTGFFHACARLGSGAAKCWGYNLYGRLGDGTTTDRSRPVGVKSLSSGVSQVTGGGTHTCAVLTSGVAKCWGSNLWGQIGDGTRGNDRLVPVNVAG